jgi:hypothetical protein
MTTGGPLTAALRRVDASPPASTARIAALDALRALAEAHLQAEVNAARRHAVTWAAIGGALGVTRQAAFQRFGARPTNERSHEMTKILNDAPARTRELVDALSDGRFEDVRAVFDAALSAALSAEQLAEVWHGLTLSVGELEQVADSPALLVDGHAVTEARLEFEAGAVTCRASWADDGRLAGLYFLPAQG